MPVMNYRKGTGAETSWIIEETSISGFWRAENQKIINTAIIISGKIR